MTAYINKSIVSRRINDNSYPDMMTTYKKYCIGKPTTSTLRFYLRMVADCDEEIKTDPYNEPLKRRRLQAQASADLLNAILTHPHHGLSYETLPEIYTQLSEVV